MRIRAHHLSTIIVACCLLFAGTRQSPATEILRRLDVLAGNVVDAASDVVDVASQTDLASHECPDCGCVHGYGEKCTARYPVHDCVVGKKKLFDCQIRYERVSIPETRYCLKKTCITKKIPCPYCKPVCKPEECQDCYGQEKWEKHCLQCGQLHCKHIEPQVENVPVKHCEHQPGETTITVKYWSCVKVPYTVYRQVKRPVCVKQPYYRKVEVPVTRYVCEHCHGTGCSHCCDN